MTDFEAAVEWLVSSGRVASKGAARRRLIEQGQKRLEAEQAIERGEGPEWVQRIAGGLAGARPATPNIAYAGQASGVATQGLMETFTPSGEATRSVGDWLERTDYGFGLGLLLSISACITVIAAPAFWPLALVLGFAALLLCWWFG